MKFKDSLINGKVYENIVLNRIIKKYPQSFIADGFCKEYDIFIPENNKKIEVKADKKSNFTGNLVVEIEMFNKPSGLLFTGSDYWVFCDGNELIWITPNDLKYIIIWNNLKVATFVGNGDTEKKRAFLVKKELIRNYKKSLVYLLDESELLKIKEYEIK